MKWFEKYIGCAFHVYGEERVFQGTCENPDTKTGKPLQYVFEPGNVVVPYKEARTIMGAMIDKYSRKENIMEYIGKYVALKPWARKDISRPYGARNMYRVIRETEKAVYVVPVDYNYKQEPDLFWAPKSAVTDVIDTSMHFDD